MGKDEIFVLPVGVRGLSLVFMPLSMRPKQCLNLVRLIVLLLTSTDTHASFSPCSSEESNSACQDQTLKCDMEGGAAQVNCNGVIGITDDTEDSNAETLRRQEDVQNANDCDAHTVKQEPGSLNSPNEDSSASQETDSCTPVTSEVSETMVCQSSPVKLSEQDISQLQESICAGTPSGDEQEHNGPLGSKGTTQMPLWLSPAQRVLRS